jgi:pyridoxal biosynthesis lyase PdxS
MYISEDFRLKVGLAEMLKGGVIMDVTNVEQAKIAENAGATAVMALERVPADIRKEGGVARMASIRIIRDIMGAVSIPVMAKARIGHFTEARVLEALGVDYIDESEVLTPADEEHHIDKRNYKVPFVCGARNLGEALRRIAEGAAMIRTKGEAGSGNIVEAVRHIRTIVKEMKQLTVLGKEELVHESKNLGARPPMPRWSCNWARKRCSSAAASLNPKIPTLAPAPSSRPRPSSTTPRNCSKPVKSWERRCAGWTSPNCRKASCFRHEAGSEDGWDSRSAGRF